jgi:hypothetical protein
MSTKSALEGFRAEYEAKKMQCNADNPIDQAYFDAYGDLAHACASRQGPTRTLLDLIQHTQKMKARKRKHTIAYQIYVKKLAIFNQELVRIAPIEGYTEVALKDHTSHNESVSMWCKVAGEKIFNPDKTRYEIVFVHPRTNRLTLAYGSMIEDMWFEIRDVELYQKYSLLEMEDRYHAPAYHAILVALEYADPIGVLTRHIQKKEQYHDTNFTRNHRKLRGLEIMRNAIVEMEKVQPIMIEDYS